MPGADAEHHRADQQREVGAEAAPDLGRDLAVAAEIEVHERGDQEVAELHEQRPRVAERLRIEPVQGEEGERADGHGEQRRGEHPAQGEDGERVGHPSGRQGSVPVMRVTVTGGAGYIGATATRELLAAGHEVTVLDSLLHGQEDVAAALEAAGARVVRGDVRDAAARRAALDGAEAVVHLAAIVGDPACAKDPELSQAVNVEATRALVEDAGVERIVFASTCSNYGRMADPLVPGRRGRAARAGLALRRAEGGDRARAARAAERDLPALRHDLRRRRAHALRPHRQRVHARPVGRPHARRLRRAVLAPVRARRRRGARDARWCSRRRRSAWPAASSTSATATRTTASSTSSS